MSGEKYLTATEAAALLGVSVATLYVYVGRKGLRSRPVPGSRERRYLRADIEQELLRRNTPRSAAADPPLESSITQITDQGHFYRGQSAIELSKAATLEDVAALLWQTSAEQVFADEVPKSSAHYDALASELKSLNSVDRATALLHVLEEANPRSFDLTPEGMARTGADIIRWLSAILLQRSAPATTPIHEVVANALNLDDSRADLARRLLILSADHGLEPGAKAVRAVASTGVSPWRSVTAGLLVASGRRNWFGYGLDVWQLLGEILDGPDAKEPIFRRLRQGQYVPGFESSLYAGHDPRGRALLVSCEKAFPNDPDIERLNTAVALVREWSDREPDFPFARAFANRKLGVGQSDALYSLARSTGWIAHAIEQYTQDDRRRTGNDRASMFGSMMPHHST